MKVKISDIKKGQNFIFLDTKYKITNVNVCLEKTFSRKFSILGIDNNGRKNELVYPEYFTFELDENNNVLINN